LEDCRLNVRVGEGPKVERAAALLFSVLVVDSSFPVTRLSDLLAEYLLLTLP
jgi:hypothetical protein